MILWAVNLTEAGPSCTRSGSAHFEMLSSVLYQCYSWSEPLRSAVTSGKSKRCIDLKEETKLGVPRVSEGVL